MTKASTAKTPVVMRKAAKEEARDPTAPPEAAVSRREEARERVQWPAPAAARVRAEALALEEAPGPAEARGRAGRPTREAQAKEGAPATAAMQARQREAAL